MTAADEARAELLARWGLTETTARREARSALERQKWRDRQRRLTKAADDARWSLTLHNLQRRSAR